MNQESKQDSQKAKNQETFNNVREQICAIFRANGLAAHVIMIAPELLETQVHIQSMTIRLLDHPKGCLVTDGDGVSVKKNHTMEEHNVSNAMMLSMSKKLAMESDYIFDKIDHDFMITNADKILKPND